MRAEKTHLIKDDRSSINMFTLIVSQLFLLGKSTVSPRGFLQRFRQNNVAFENIFFLIPAKKILFEIGLNNAYSIPIRDRYLECTFCWGAGDQPSCVLLVSNSVSALGFVLDPYSMPFWIRMQVLKNRHLKISKTSKEHQSIGRYICNYKGSFWLNLRYRYCSIQSTIFLTIKSFYNFRQVKEKGWIRYRTQILGWIRIRTKRIRIPQCCGAGPTLTRLRLPAPAPDNNIFATQI